MAGQPRDKASTVCRKKSHQGGLNLMGDVYGLEWEG